MTQIDAVLVADADAHDLSELLTSCRMDLVQCRTLLGSLLQYCSSAGASRDAAEAWHRLTELVQSTCDTDEDRALAANLLFDQHTGLFRFTRLCIAAQGASSLAVHPNFVIPCAARPGTRRHRHAASSMHKRNPLL